MANLFSKHRAKLREQSKKQKRVLVEKTGENSLNSEAEGPGNASMRIKDSAPGLIECHVLSLSHEGRGIAKHKGKTQFVHYALPGETVLASVVAHRAKYDELEAVKIIQSSAQRVAPLCQHYGRCGGCSLQHLAHAQQLEHKQRVLAEQLKHFGELSPEQWLPAVVGEPWAYRSRVRLSVDYGRKAEKLRIGFRKRSSKETLAIESCPIMASELSNALPILKELVARLSGHKVIGHLALSQSSEGVALLVRQVKPLDKSDLDKLCGVARQYQWTLFLQTGDVSSIRKLWPKNEQTYLSYNLRVMDEDLELQFHPKDFTQINLGVNQKMVQLALQMLDLGPGERSLDLFSGLGNFTLAMAKHSALVVGVEGSQEMVERGSSNAELNGIDNVSFIKTNLYGDFSQQPWAQEVYDKILIDPPRAGAFDVISKIGQLKAKRIVYISCNPATLARDAGLLVKQGYQLKRAGILDMFPHTEHVESIAVFDRNVRD